jgi:hypothetical protein
MHEMAKSKSTSTQDKKKTPAGGEERKPHRTKPVELLSLEAMALSFAPTKPSPAGTAQQENLMRLAQLVHQKLEQIPPGDLDGAVKLRFSSDEFRVFADIDSYYIFEMCNAIAKQNPRFAGVSIACLFEKTNESEWMSDNSSHLLPLVRKAISQLVSKIDKSPNPAGDVSEPLAAYLQEMNVPRKKWREAALELARVVLRFGAPDDRPRWDDRAKYPELAFLPAPEFLKRVWADQIGPNGEVDKTLIRQIDRPLIKTVEAYVSNRQRRNRDPGQVKGLQLLSRGKGPADGE